MALSTTVLRRGNTVVMLHEEGPQTQLEYGQLDGGHKLNEDAKKAQSILEALGYFVVAQPSTGAPSA